MDLALSGEQVELVEAFSALYGRESTGERVRASEATGFDDRLWRALCETGSTTMGVDEHNGGWGASLLDLALVAERHGRAVAPAPLIETQVAARLLSRCIDGGSGAAHEALAAALSGEEITTLALRPARRARLELVPAGSICHAVIAMVEDRLVLVRVSDNRTPVANLASMSLADIEVGGKADGDMGDVAVLATGTDASDLFSSAIDEWLMLTSAALVGIGARAVEIGAAYATERRAFGVAIGSFQAVSHRLADCATAIDGARLLTYEAACAFDDEPERASELAAMAFWFAYESARDATYRSLHVHGGYGFMMEQDIQLYYRRARGWANVYGGPRNVLDRVADLRYG